MSGGQRARPRITCLAQPISSSEQFIGKGGKFSVLFVKQQLPASPDHPVRVEDFSAL